MTKAKIKTILMAIAILLVFALLGGFIAQIVLKNKDNVSDSDGSLIVSDGGATVTEIEGNGVTLTSEKIERSAYAASGISETAVNAYTLTATITPDNATDKTVDWAVAFVNPSSTWASGKTVTDYATITPSSDGALTATLTCLQAFGEQIKVTVTSRNNSSATATCTLDYVKRISDIDLYFLGGDCAGIDNCSGDTTEVTLTGLNNTFVTGFKISFCFGVGTICDEMSDICLTIPGGDGYDVGWTKESDTEYSYTETITWSTVCNSIGYTTQNAMYEKMKTAYDNNEAYSFTVEGKGATIGSWSFTGFGLLINPEGLYTYATGITLSNSSIKF